MVPRCEVQSRESPRFLLGAALAVSSLFVAGSAYAQPPTYNTRADSWEFTVAVPYVASKTFDADGGAKVDVNSSVGLGFGFNYNFDEKLALGLDIAWNSPSFDATLVQTDPPPSQNHRSSGEMETSDWQFNLRYSFMPGAFTPFVAGGLGWTYIDSNIADGPPGASCWWDPWYGNICYGYQPTYSDWRFSYNAAVGVRWDLNESVFLRASVGEHWIDMPSGGSDGATGGRFEVGFKM